MSFFWHIFDLAKNFRDTVVEGLVFTVSRIAYNEPPMYIAKGARVQLYKDSKPENLIIGRAGKKGREGGGEQHMMSFSIMSQML